MKTVVDVVTAHWKHSLWIVTALALLALLGMNVVPQATMVEQLLVVVVFSLFSAATFVLYARSAVKSNSRRLMQVFLTHSTLRMLVAAVTIWIYTQMKGWMQTTDRKPLLAFVIMFAVFYLVLLAFDAFRVMSWQRKITESE